MSAPGIIAIVCSSLVAVLALTAVAMELLCRCPDKDSRCRDDIVREISSPNGRSVGLVIRRNCGATAPFVAAVGIRHDGRTFDFGRDIFFLIKGEGKDIDLVWRDSPLLDVAQKFPILTIVYDKPPWIYRQAIVWGMERIAYRER
jgi:hypothetical protein